jgi:hypothetical protein
VNVNCLHRYKVVYHVHALWTLDSIADQLIGCSLIEAMILMAWGSTVQVQYTHKQFSLSTIAVLSVLLIAHSSFLLLESASTDGDGDDDSVALTDSTGSCWASRAGSVVC